MEVSRVLDIPPEHVAKVIQYTLYHVVEEVCNGKYVYFPGFGHFVAWAFAPRVATAFPQHCNPKFVPSAHFTAQVRYRAKPSMAANMMYALWLQAVKQTLRKDAARYRTGLEFLQKRYYKSPIAET
jgi:nucleoid DNA-binding protein